jgi:hypothetical protein
MRIPMLILGGCCVAIGVTPITVAPLMDRLAESWSADGIALLTIAGTAPLGAISIVGAVLVLLLGLGTGFLLLRGVQRAPTTVTWDCGYAAPSARMQYSSSSFAEMLVHLFGWALRPREERPRIRELFPTEAHFHSHVEDTVLERAVWPATHAVTRLFSWGRYLQSGSLQAYLMYILLVIVFLLLWR